MTVVGEAMLLASEVTVGRTGPPLWPGRDALPETPGIAPLTAVAGSYTITALYGVPVGMPAALVGVMRPVMVIGAARPLANEVTVGRTAAPLLPGTPPGVEAPMAVAGSKMITAL